jgi:hypothetical protein
MESIPQPGDRLWYWHEGFRDGPVEVFFQGIVSQNSYRELGFTVVESSEELLDHEITSVKTVSSTLEATLFNKKTGVLVKGAHLDDIMAHLVRVRTTGRIVGTIKVFLANLYWSQEDANAAMKKSIGSSCFCRNNKRPI